MRKRPDLRLRRLAGPLPLAALLAASCMLPMSKVDFDKALLGPPSMVYEDFETNDGATSTRYDWTYGRDGSSGSTKPAISRTWSWNGGFSLFFKDYSAFNSSLELSVKLPAGSTLSYVIHKTDAYYYPTLSDLCALYKLNGKPFTATISDTSYEKLSDDGSTYRVKTILTSECASFSLRSGYAYLDDLRVNIPEFGGMSPGADSAVSNGLAEFKWGAYPGASSYRIQVSADASFANPILNLSGQGASPYRYSVPARDTMYYWRAGADGATPYATIWSNPSRFVAPGTWADEGFETGTLASCWIPSTQGSLSVSSSRSSTGTRSLALYSQNQEVSFLRFVDIPLAATLSFRFYQEGANSLRVYVDDVLASTISAPTNTWRTGSVAIPAGAHKLSFRWTGYYNAIYFDDFSLPLDGPSGLVPADLSFVPSGSIALDWNDFAGASSYRLQVASDASFGGALLADASGLASSDYSFAPAAPGAVTYWRAGADGVAGAAGTLWSAPSRILGPAPWTNEGFESAAAPVEWVPTGAALALSTSLYRSGTRSLAVTPSASSATITRYADFASAGTLQFYYYNTSSSSTILSVSVDGTQATTSTGGYYAWKGVTVPLSAGTHVLRIAWPSSQPLYLDDAMFFSNGSVLTSLDFEGASVPASLTAKSGSLQLSAAQKHGGAQSLRFSSPVNSYTTAVAYANPSAATTLTFWLRLDASADDFYVYVDGSQVLNAYPTTWTQRSVSLAAGPHIIEFRYRSSAAGYSAYIDDLVLP